MPSLFPSPLLVYPISNADVSNAAHGTVQRRALPSMPPIPPHPPPLTASPLPKVPPVPSLPHPPIMRAGVCHQALRRASKRLVEAPAGDALRLQASQFRQP